MFECQAHQITVRPFTMDMLTSKGNTLFCMFRHAPTYCNQKNIVQGRSIDNDIITPIPDENMMQYLFLHSMGFTKVLANTLHRTVETARLLSNFSRVIQDERFDEQDLEHFEGQDKNVVLADPQFQKLFTNPDFCVAQVESGKQVIERLLQGIDAAAERDSLIGICTSQCVMNWFLKWVNNNYLRFYSIKNLDFILFLYDKDHGSITVLPCPIGLNAMSTLFGNNLCQNIAFSERIKENFSSVASDVFLKNQLGIQEAMAREWRIRSTYVRCGSRQKIIHRFN